MQRLRPSRAGHLYFELIEKGAGDEIVGKLEAVVWRRDHRRISRVLEAAGTRLEEGHAIRCRARLDFYAPFGRLQLVVAEVDPLFTLGLLERRRRETLEALAAAGLLERNAALELAPVPQELALVTSAGSAACQDFLAALGASGYGFRVRLLHASVQGRAAEREVSTALERAGRLGVDCAVVVRGGGARTDLAVFDSRRIAEAVARCPVPVLTGLGHQTDRAIADVVAHSAFTTPTQAAEFLVRRVGAAEADVEARAARLRRAADAALGRQRHALGRLERGLRAARFRVRAAAEAERRLRARLDSSARSRLRAAARRLDEMAARLGRAAPRPLAASRRTFDRRRRRLARAGESRLREARSRLAGWRRLVGELSPERTLERGFTITRDATGAVVRDAERLAAGDRLVTQFARGRATSRVEER